MAHDPPLDAARLAFFVAAEAIAATAALPRRTMAEIDPDGAYAPDEDEDEDEMFSSQEVPAPPRPEVVSTTLTCHQRGSLSGNCSADVALES